LENIVERQNVAAAVRGRGLILGVEFEDSDLADNISKACFDRGLVIETAGIDGQVLKLLPTLTVTDDELKQGLSIIEDALHAVLQADSEVEVASVGA
jgi:diaminobutyrate-2-oxoglutarate transaminase